ncbi:VOC family protein [Shinella sp.]|uniref:VOC family protein n=1 Tax=Shinella sp. TaxID=1870904 RepID=UPI0029BC1F31|nr:VOC family protein [Shinella sp.]MDX3973036.1 VOC family protein [Shinella sp.]
MISPGLLILYVEDPARSSHFYGKLLDRTPVFVSPGYVGFDFGNGLGLGLWSTTSTEFVSGGTGNRSEIAIVLDGDNAIDAIHDKWKAEGVEIEQSPFDAVFGRTFVARDPDGHRIRICPPDK